MSDAVGMRHVAAPTERSRVSSLLSKPWLVTLLYCFAVIAVLLIFNRDATDYVGADNDDALRLVEVRDLLGGQGWFDMMQYRMGLDGGTLMHWSRFIDLPIACLIAFFRLFAAPERAEALALAVWPVSLVFPMMFAMALVGRRIGGVPGLHVALAQTGLLIVGSNRFVPGSIDHDNVQLCLVALLAAMLVDEKFRPLSYVVAGVAAAVAIGIGAETTPFIAVVCVVVAVLWAWEGAAFAAAARAFALTLTVAISIAFFSTVPPHLYSTVTCDNLSLGFYGITSVGGAALLVSAILASRLSRPWRFAVLAANGAVVLATTLVLAPNCLHNPLADLDPMLIKFWLNAVTEAQSVVSVAGRLLCCRASRPGGMPFPNNARRPGPTACDLSGAAIGQLGNHCVSGSWRAVRRSACHSAVNAVYPRSAPRLKRRYGQCCSGIFLRRRSIDLRSGGLGFRW
jgi:hypothetical protein